MLKTQSPVVEYVSIRLLFFTIVFSRMFNFAQIRNGVKIPNMINPKIFFDCDYSL